jgi:ABC-type polysaccharide/polyol phosphate transport system ATPase subunit
LTTSSEREPAARETRIRLRDVSVCYRLAKQRPPSLKEYAIHLLQGRLRYEQLWALNDLSLTIGSGEWVGVIGPNGAGKSTLLKVISGVLTPTRGEVHTSGWVAPILQLGTGFDFEMTGLENIYLNALLLGRTRREVESKVEAIVAFSGLEGFVHSPIRNYSSGMLARLGFSIATAWVPDVLILDEVLAVGDASFVHKCERRLQEVQAQGTTIILVTHDLRAVARNCTRCLWLHKGRVQREGSPAEVVEAYQAASEAVNRAASDGSRAGLDPSALGAPAAGPRAAEDGVVVDP